MDRRYHTPGPLVVSSVRRTMDGQQWLRIVVEADSREVAYVPFGDLGGANLRSADLGGANLRSADLGGADLGGANLGGDALRAFRADMWVTLTEAKDPNEVRFLIAALKAGAVDGSTYGDGKRCACLVGTLARFHGQEGESRDHSSDRPAEGWFMMISVGDVPGRTDAEGVETGGGFAARMALDWALAWCAATGTNPEFPKRAKVPALGPVGAPA